MNVQFDGMVSQQKVGISMWTYNVFQHYPIIVYPTVVVGLDYKQTGYRLWNIF